MENYPSLLVTKVRMPRVRPSQVARPRLLAAMDKGVNKSLILVAAAAGFGKTTLAAEWCGRYKGQTAWLSLEPGDSDPVRFLSYLIAAVQQPYPAFGRELLAALQSAQPPSVENVLYSLVNQLATLPGRLILVLDDYHVIEDAAVHDSLSFLLEHRPSHVTLVLLSRSDPPLPLPRMRVRNELVELRAENLRFSGSETADFLNETMGLDLPGQAMAALETRTEGWIAGLQLAAIALQSLPEDQAEFIDAFTGSHRFILDYLMEEVLSHQPADVRKFLVMTSFLRRFCAPLGDAVMELGGEPFGKSQAMLDYLEKHNLFLIPLDYTRNWFRYHHLFADLLEARLVDEIGNGIQALRRRTAEWLEANGQAEEAVEYALEGEAYEYAAGLIAGPAASVFHRGEIKTLLAWYKALPADHMEDNPYLCLQFGLAFALNGHWGEAERLLVQFETVYEARVKSAGPDFVVTHSREIDLENLVVLAFMIASHRQDVAALQAIIERVSQEPRPTPSTKTILGLIHFILGEYETTSRLLGEAQKEAEEQEDWATAFNALLQHGRMKVYMGHLQASHALCLLALERSDLVEKGLISQISLAFSVLGRIYIEWDEPEKAMEYLKKAVEAGERSGFRTGMLSSNMIMQAEAHDAQGELELAQEAAEQALVFAARHDPPAEVEWLKTYQARLWLNEGNLTAAAAWLEELERMQRERPLPVSMFYPSQIRPVTKARTLLGQRRTAEAIEILTELTAERPMLLTAEAFALLALARQANGDSVNAHLALEQTLMMAEPERRLRLFLNLGRPMQQLLAAFCEQKPNHPQRPFARMVLERFPDDLEQTALIEPLSDRELEILGLIMAGHSNQEIADSLFLALSTVKWYINVIYGKLQVKSRSQAIAKAHEMGRP